MARIARSQSPRHWPGRTVLTYPQSTGSGAGMPLDDLTEREREILRLLAKGEATASRRGAVHHGGTVAVISERLSKRPARAARRRRSGRARTGRDSQPHPTLPQCGEPERPPGPSYRRGVSSVAAVANR